MLPTLLNQSTVPVLEQTVNFAQSRHGVLAGNIANIDTPGYKTRDLSPELFQKTLKRAIEARNAPPEPELSPGLRMPHEREQHLEQFDEVSESTKHILYHDLSDVSLESQVAELAKNQSLHSVAVSLLSQQFRLLESAISERVA
jgi:flagellar basal-body rod protein FlgB